MILPPGWSFIGKDCQRVTSGHVDGGWGNPRSQVGAFELVHPPQSRSDGTPREVLCHDRSCREVREA